MPPAMGVFRRRLTLSIASLAFLLVLSSVSARQFSIGERKIGEEEEVARRRLGGLGSSPPSCRSKCGRCAPCKPVHVPIQPGMSIPLEYYPEAWRCKCGNKLYMP